MSERLKELLETARAAQQNAYAPFSRFRVGAALETEQGSVFSGCNIENASFGLTICAERVAIGSAVTAGERKFRRLVLVTDSDVPEAPCGACRQVISEFAPGLEIVSYSPGGASRSWQAAELLPEPFFLIAEGQPQ